MSVAAMVPMMLPAWVPVLWRCHRALRQAGDPHVGRFIGLVVAGYCIVWSAVGLAVFPAGVALAAIPEPLPVLGVLLMVAGLLQFTAWKSHHLACCRADSGHDPGMAASSCGAWRYGVHHGVHCACCCAGPTAVLLAAGIMDLRAMALVMLAVTIERIAPGGNRVARALGVAAITAGAVLVSRALLQSYKSCA